MEHVLVRAVFLYLPHNGNRRPLYRGSTKHGRPHVSLRLHNNTHHIVHACSLSIVFVCFQFNISIFQSQDGKEGEGWKTAAGQGLLGSQGDWLPIQGLLQTRSAQQKMGVSPKVQRSHRSLRRPRLLDAGQLTIFLLLQS